jgi:predicted nucleotidyltransferase
MLIFGKEKQIEMNQIPIQTRISESIHSADPNAIAYLFGSRARGDFKP